MKLLRILPLFLIFITTLPAAAQSRKGVAILGDSYSTFEGYVSPDTNYVWYFAKPNPDLTDVSSPQQLWWHVLLRDKGMRLVTNNSFSGSTVCNTGYNGDDYSARSFLARASNLGSPDVILVLGATNDTWAGAPIGEYVYENPTPEQLYSYRPALAALFQSLLDRYPGVEIHFILNSELSPEINESTATICDHYGINLIRLTDIDKRAGHPTVLGMRQIAEQVAPHL